MFSDVLPGLATSNMLRENAEIFVPAFPFVKAYVKKNFPVLLPLYGIKFVKADANELYKAAGVYIIDTIYIII